MSVVAKVLATLEKHHGRIADLVKPKPVITASQLQRDHLEALFRHEASAIHIPGFYPAAAAGAVSEEVLRDPSRQQVWMTASGRGLESSDVRTLGVKPYNMVAGSKDEKEIEAYFEAALPTMREFRAGLRLGPLDKLRLELDEVWPQGATVTKNKDGRPFVAGLVRVMHGPTAWPEGFCHVDDLSPLSTEQGLFSANIYLQLPRTGGGDLHIWDVEVWSRWDFYRHATTLSHLTVPDLEGQTRLRRRFPPPRTVKLGVGDLVLLCAQRPHAVQGFPLGTRVSVQSFITHKQRQPLSLDN